MIISDGWLVPYAGYKVAAPISSSFKGRAIYTSERWGNMLAVVGDAVYGLQVSGDSGDLSAFFIGQIETFNGDIFIDENIVGEIAICDGQQLYIYNWANPTNPALVIAPLPIDPQTGNRVVPGYVTYQDGYFIVTNEESAGWFLSALNNGLSWNWGTSGTPVTANIQTKATNAVAALRAPGLGNLLMVFGRNVTEMWYDVGNPLFPYQRSTSISVDYGCLNPATISTLDNNIAWLGVNDRSGPVIMVSQGGNVTRLSNDGIDYQLANLSNPQDSYGFFFKQDGHLFYQLTFPEDNFSLTYDFNTQTFFSPTDENMNYHVAERVAFYNNSYYFVSINDGNVYRMGSDLTTYDYTVPGGASREYEIPMVRVCPPIRLPDSSRFVVPNITFTVDQGNDPYYNISHLFLIAEEDGTVIGQEDEWGISEERVLEPYTPHIDLSISKDGANTFGSYVTKTLNPLGVRKNRVVYWQLGAANDLTCQFRFWTKSRMVVTDGIVSLYQ